MSITSTAFKSLTMPESCLISSPSSLFYNKTKHPFFSLPSKPLKFHFSSLNNNNYNNPSPLSLSITTKTTQHHHRYPGPVFVAQTSDWAQQEGDNTLTTLQDQQEGEEEEEGVSETEAGLSDWDLPSGEGGEGEEEEGGFVEPPEEAKLFVGSLPFDVDSQKLAMLFEQAGTVEIAEVIYNRETDQSRGFGFVTMSTVEEAERAVEKFNRYDYNGRVLVVNKASPRGSRPERQPRNSGPVFRVYVGNLPWDVDNTRLEQVFSEHGKVVNARVVYDRDSGRSRGFGFVTMTDETGMNDAIAALDGQSLDGRTIRVSVAESRRGLF